ncbi:MAG: ABC transporter permease [archaeon]
MRLLEIIWKEISLIKAQKVALLLIFLYPFIAIALLGSAFTGLEPQKMTNINAGVVNDLSFDSNIIGELSQYKEIKLTEYGDANKLLDAIKKKEVIVGVRISGATKNDQLKVDLYYDNSNLMASRFFLEIAKAVMQRITIEATQQKLKGIFTTVNGLEGTLTSEVNNIKEFQAKLNTAGSKIDKLEKDLNAINFDEIKTILSEQQSNLDSLEQKTADFKTKFSTFKTSFNKAKSDLGSIEPQILLYQSQLKTTSTSLASTISSLDQSISQLESISPYIPAEQKASFDSSLSSMRTQEQLLKDWNSTLNSSITSMDSALTSLDGLDTSMKDAESMMVTLETDEAALETSLTSANTALENMNSKLTVFSESVEEVHLLISDARLYKEDISEKLGTSLTMLSSFSDEISNISAISPVVLAQPVVFYENKAFNVDPFGILVANATVVVLILTCMLLTAIVVILERNQNVTLRMTLCTTHKMVLLFGKIIGQLILALIEATIIFIVAFTNIPLPAPIMGFTKIGFGLVASFSIIELYFAVIIIALAFISIGMIISLFAKNQSTAILSSLLLIVPMLFLSGIILPVEFMEPFMRMVSEFLPLTLANNLLIGVIVKGASLAEMGVEVIALLFITFITVIIVLLKDDTRE